MTLPEDVLFILNTLAKHKHEAFLVGGCVRDSVMGVAPHDWDIATSALPSDVKKIFSHTVDTGLQHGTVTVIHKRVHYEVTTYRIDGMYKDSRRPVSVSFSSHIKDDLSRRDFTMNAIAYNPAHGFVDPFNGCADIENKIIRCVGTAMHRFEEDALRMLRAVRFAAQLGFEIETETVLAIKKCSGNLKNISAERIRDELTRLLLSPFSEKIFLLDTTQLITYVLIGRPFNGDWHTIIKNQKNYPPDIVLRLVIFLSWVGTDITGLLRDLRFDNKTIHEVSTLVTLLPADIPRNRYELKKCMSKINPVLTEKLLMLKNAEEMVDIVQDIISKKECFTLKELAIKGHQLIEIGIKPGKEMGLLLEELLDTVMRNPEMNTFDKLIRIIPQSFS